MYLHLILQDGDDYIKDNISLLNSEENGTLITFGTFISHKTGMRLDRTIEAERTKKRPGFWVRILRTLNNVQAFREITSLLSHFGSVLGPNTHCTNIYLYLYNLYLYKVLSSLFQEKNSRKK